MQGHKQFVNKVVLRVQLSERVLPHNLYRRLGELLDWDFLVTNRLLSRQQADSWTRLSVIRQRVAPLERRRLCCQALGSNAYPAAFQPRICHVARA